MKVVDLNGREYHWQLAGHRPTNRKCSKLHLEARDTLNKLYPNIILLEEVPIRIYRGKLLYLDFYIPMYKKAIEVHGQQHYAFNSQFHKHKLDFKRQQLNDTLKEEWCDKNQITLIILPFDRIAEWRRILKS